MYRDPPRPPPVGVPVGGNDGGALRVSSFSVPGAQMAVMLYLGGGFLRACMETSRKLHSKWQGQ
jgi:hypothetical protein